MEKEQPPSKPTWLFSWCSPVICEQGPSESPLIFTEECCLQGEGAFPPFPPALWELTLPTQGGQSFRERLSMLPLPGQENARAYPPPQAQSPPTRSPQTSHHSLWDPPSSFQQKQTCSQNSIRDRFCTCLKTKKPHKSSRAPKVNTLYF